MVNSALRVLRDLDLGENGTASNVSKCLYITVLKVEKQEEILIDKYYSYVKIIPKVVLDIYWVVVLLKVC